MSYIEKITKLIEDSGGKIEDKLFVVEPGCLILDATKVTQEASTLHSGLGIDNKDEYEDISEFNARLCYLSFNSVKKNNINDTLVQLGHLSIFKNIHVTFLVAGVSDEVLKEFCAHSEASISRLTSAKTYAMTNTLYRIFGSKEDMDLQKKYILEFIELRKKYVSEYYVNCENAKSGSIEVNNMFNLGMKATAFTFNMSLKDYHKLFIGRMGEAGNENDIRLICQKMCIMLHQLYPTVIRDVDYYLKSNNNDKYSVE